MAYTTPELVAEIIEVDESISMLPFISPASSLVSELCEGVNGPSPAYDAARLTLIESYLAAHFYEIRDKRVSSEKAGSVGENKYSIKTELYLDNSQYGQMALFLDTNGSLAEWNERLKKGTAGKKAASLSWLGLDYTGHSLESPY